MTHATPPQSRQPSGIHIRDDDATATREQVLHLLRPLGLDSQVDVLPAKAELAPHPQLAHLQFSLKAALAEAWMPGHDTLELCQRLSLDTLHDLQDLDREILLTMLVAPIPFVFPSVDELASAVRIRRNIVRAARKTALAFHTEAAERPEDYWHYDDDHGFLLQPGADLITALQKATQPEVSGKLYSFSCYRATEYVIQLGIAQELLHCNPALLAALQRHGERQAIRSGKFHDVFLYEYGSMDNPLPPRYYVPGDRLWFRNPDERSADVTGFEGSWVFYEGGGLFSNFWQRDRPFTFIAKCLEIFHWRHGAFLDAAGELKMDEDVVAQRVQATLADPAEVARIVKLMARLREPKGVYVDGGCIDTTREYPRRVRPGTADIPLPPL